MFCIIGMQHSYPERHHSLMDNKLSRQLQVMQVFASLKPVCTVDAHAMNVWIEQPQIMVERDASSILLNQTNFHC